MFIDVSCEDITKIHQTGQNSNTRTNETEKWEFVDNL